MNLDKKYQELLGIAAAIGMERGDLLDHHVRTAREAGATQEEIRDTLLVAVKVRSVRMRECDAFTEKIRRIHFPKPESSLCPSA